MKRLILPIAIAASAALAAPAGAVAAPVSGALIQVGDHGHALRVAEGQQVHTYTSARRLPRGAKPGVRVRFQANGAAARAVQVRGHARGARFYARVKRAAKARAVLGLADGHRFDVRATQDTASSLPLAGLQPGQVVLVAIRFVSHGDVRVKLSLPSAGAAALVGDEGPSCAATEDPDDPGAEADDPAADPDDPADTGEDRANTTDDPCAADDPGATADDPADPGDGPDDPGDTPEDPGDA